MGRGTRGFRITVATSNPTTIPITLGPHCTKLPRNRTRSFGSSSAGRTPAMKKMNAYRSARTRRRSADWSSRSTGSPDDIPRAAESCSPGCSSVMCSCMPRRRLQRVRRGAARWRGVGRRGAGRRAARASKRPLVVHTMYAHAAAADALRRRGVPVFAAIERAVGVLARLAAHGERAAGAVPAVPPPAAPPTATTGYAEARALLAAGGVPFAPARTVARPTPRRPPPRRRSATRSRSRRSGTLHKSDAGGVVARPRRRADAARRARRPARPPGSVDVLGRGDGLPSTTASSC